LLAQQKDLLAHAKPHCGSLVLRDEACTVVSARIVVPDDGSSVRAEVWVRIAVPGKMGDKFRVNVLGQKTTMTEQPALEDMPYSVATGLRPHILFSPVGVLSRSTAGLLQEAHKAQAAALVGRECNATAFRSEWEKAREVDAVATLLAHGLEGYGYERHVDARTGRLIDRPLFVGYLHVTAMPQLVELKEYARNYGTLKTNTWQPEDGRGRDGGLRTGRMEKDVFFVQGAMSVMTHLMMTVSDGHRVAACRRCGQLCEAGESFGSGSGAGSDEKKAKAAFGLCRVCLTSDQIAIVEMPFSNVALQHGTAALNHHILLGVQDDARTTSLPASTPVTAPTPSSVPPAAAAAAAAAMSLEPVCELGDVPPLPAHVRLREPVVFREAEAASLLQFPRPSAAEFHRLGVRPPLVAREFLQSLQTVAPPPPVPDAPKAKR
jgi:DNA-directed RNA polymerase beta subunit